MVESFGDYLYKELKHSGGIDKFSKKNSTLENVKILDDLLLKLNITKGTITDVEKSYPDSTNHLTYLIQTRNSIDFNVCEMYKVWKNRDGWQYGCALDKGKGKRIQVYCLGNQNNCERSEQLKNTLEARL